MYDLDSDAMEYRCRQEKNEPDAPKMSRVVMYTGLDVARTSSEQRL